MAVEKTYIPVKTQSIIQLRNTITITIGLIAILQHTHHIANVKD